jgi:hypothetical protein
MSVAPGDLLRDTSLAPDGERPGRYVGSIPEAWRVVYAFGGVTMTASLRAMEAHLRRPDLPLVTANAIFCAPVPCGPVAVDVEVLRNGRGAAQVGSNLFVPGTDGVALRTHGVFGRPHDTDLAFRDLEFPADIALPDACEPPPPRPLDDPWPEINFHDQTEWLPALPFARPGEERTDQPKVGERARFASWTRLRVEPRRADGSYDMLALAVPRFDRSRDRPGARRQGPQLHEPEPRDRHPLHPAARGSVGAAAHALLALRRRLRDRPHRALGRAREPARDRAADRTSPPAQLRLGPVATVPVRGRTGTTGFQRRAG